MQFFRDQSGDASIVRVQGAKLTYPVLAPFFAEVRAMVDAGVREVVIDLEAVTYIDSATIGCLVEIHRLLEARGGSVKLCGLQRRVETMLSMTGVHRFLNVQARAARREDPVVLRGFARAAA
jgi:anti-anti-sigma factor